MDRDALVRLLDDGLSLEAIGRYVGSDASTVAYWLEKHGLEANGREKHAPRGGLPREALEPLVEAGLTLREIADEVGRSVATVRHWLAKYGLGTSRARRPIVHMDTGEVVGDCRRHGRTEFALRRSDGYYRCLKCRSADVARRRRRVKEILVEEAGGSCRICGYDRYVGALQFHHLDPATKSFSLSHEGITRSLEAARAEARKCILLCSNCHAEVEAAIVRLPNADGLVPQK